MPPYQQAHRHAKAVLWPADGVDSHGKPKVSAPEELDVRWVGKRQEVSDGRGGSIIVSGTAVVDREIEEGSQMWSGKLADLPDSSDMSQEARHLMQVVGYVETPDTKGRAVLRKVLLSRSTDTIPTGG